MLLRYRTCPEFSRTSCLKTSDSGAAHAPAPRIPGIRNVYAGGISIPALACAIFLLQSLVPSPSQAEFDPPRVASKVSDSYNTEQLRYYMDSGIESGIERGDVLNVYREKSLIRGAPHPIRLLIGRMTITESQPGLSEGIDYLVRKHLPDGRRPNIYYWYYATQVMHHWGGTDWELWNRRMRDVLITSRETRGHRGGSWLSRGSHDSAGGRLYATSLAICTLI